MNPARFDRIARVLGTPTSRRATVLGGLAAALAGVGIGPLARLGAARQTASPVASPLGSGGATPLGSPPASPGPLDLLASTPAAGAEVLGRDGGTCKGRLELCDGSTGGYEECCSKVCVFSFRRNVYECT